MAYVYGLFYEDKNGDDVCFYIGKGNGRRKEVHFTDCRLENDHNKHKTRKIKKCRENNQSPHSKILAEDLCDEIAHELEQSILEIDEIFNQLTNVKRGGRHNANHSEETKRKIGKANSGKNNGMKRKPTEEIQKNSGKLSREQAAEIKWLTENTDILHKRIAKEYPICKGTIRQINQNRVWKNVSPSKPQNNWHRSVDEDETFLGNSRKQRSKITKQDAQKIKWLSLNTDRTQKNIAEDYCIRKSQVSRIKLGKR